MRTANKRLSGVKLGKNVAQGPLFTAMKNIIQDGLETAWNKAIVPQTGLAKAGTSNVTFVNFCHYFGVYVTDISNQRALGKRATPRIAPQALS